MNTTQYEPSTLVLCAATACIIWYSFIILVQIIGTTQLFWHYTTSPAPAISPTLPLAQIPHITIIRPIKGLEPQLYECLSSIFHQSYPSSHLHINLCVSSTQDPAYPILQKVLGDFPTHDARIYIEEEDPNLSGTSGEGENLGPNPKIRNMSRAYREAESDIIWILDCNVWIGRGVAGRMLDTLCGIASPVKRVRPFKFVHQIPLVIDCKRTQAEEESVLLSPEVPRPRSAQETLFEQILNSGGGRLEETFMATSHAKFYTAINTVSVAPCIVGKSNMFRRSHLDYLTSPSSSSTEVGSASYGRGIDFFSHNICEDHLIGDLLWRKRVAEEEAPKLEKWGRHGIVWGDMAIQPMADMSVQEYVARRVRWLRVRKWTVTLATLVEPGVESLLCSASGAFGITTLPLFHETFGVPSSWMAFLTVWLVSVFLWIIVDYVVYAILHSCASVELDENVPAFARPPQNVRRRSFEEWIGAWLGRELLALPIWVWACLGGTTVVWRNRRFWVGMDMRVHEMGSVERRSKSTPEVEGGWKDRVD